MRAVTVALVAALAVTSLAIALFWQAPEGSPGTYAVLVEGPDGTIWTGNVIDHEGNALSALLSAADLAGFDVVVVDYAGYQPCGRYVEAIDGHRAEGSSGWVYKVQRGDDLITPSIGACAFALQPGDVVVWSWSDGASGV